MKTSPLIACYIIGSYGRRDQDNLSDLDVLAIVRNGGGKVPSTIIQHLIPSSISSIKPSISWYGQERIKKMFKNGELFAWHVFQDHITLYDPFDFLTSLGTPCLYTEGVADIISFKTVLKDIPNQIKLHKGNAIYEAGLVYVCLRNISMAASWTLCSKPDFSRYSAFKFSQLDPFPLSRTEFEMLMRCRMAGQRGAEPPSEVTDNFVVDIYRRIFPWLDELEAAVRRLTIDE